MSNSGEGGNRIYEVKKYFALALDSIHVGTGGYRIGRVDNTIVREPATGIPKIPGTTIEGCCRSYAYLKIMENDRLRSKLKEVGFNQQCAKGKVKKSEKIEPCGICPVCITFGYTRDSEREIEIEENGQKLKKKIAQSMQAMALFSDARILFFPVATMIGPVWVTCPMVLRNAGIKEMANNSEKEVPQPDNGKFIVPTFSSDSESSAIEPPENKLNFGWLLLEIDNSNKTEISKWKYKENNNSTEPLKNIIPDYVLKRIAIVPDDLFTTIVNSNLEVRTSVAIDPERGAAEEGALFTYEAIPRGTVFWFDVIYQNPKNFPSLNSVKTPSWDGNINDLDLNLVMTTVEKGLQLFKFLGVGGMGSRGFGRLRVLSRDKGDENGGRE